MDTGGYLSCVRCGTFQCTGIHLILLAFKSRDLRCYIYFPDSLVMSCFDSGVNECEMKCVWKVEQTSSCT